MKERRESVWLNLRRVSGLAAFACAAYVGACAKGSDSRAATQSSGVLSSAATSDSQSNAAKAGPASPTTPRKARGVVLFAGTSITAGLGLDPDSAYPMLIQRKIDSAGLAFEVVNAGVSGETSSGLLDRLDWLLRARFDVLVLETGANDGLRGIPASTLQSNLETALDRINAKRPDARIVLIQMEALPNLGPKYAAAFHAVYPRVAKAKGVVLLPFLLDNVAGRRGLNQGDGVHPNDVGEHIVAENVWRGLRPILQGR
ncbi:MAG TPA: arylesterase [Gemmatimonadaceae bacterium]|nr:arylesterase [Gemmatimonadaceae bacterium]